MVDPEALSRDELLVAFRDLLVVARELQARNRYLEAEVSRLKGGPPPGPPRRDPPDFVKPNRPPRPSPRKPRKRRERGYTRGRETATRVVEHYPERCSECGRKLEGGWHHSSRQVVEIPSLPYEVIEHRFMARSCGICHRRELARPDLSSEVYGQCRLGVRLMSLIAYLDTVCRMPVAGIQTLLSAVHGLHVSRGEIVRVHHTVAQAGSGAYERLLEEARASQVLHADETGSREDGVNGYEWVLSTPDLRFYHRDASRGAAVIQKLLGYDPVERSLGAAIQSRNAARAQGRTQFTGTLVSDFYSAYGWYHRSRQCCLVHLDRDLDALKAAHAQEPSVVAWADAVLDLMERAKHYARTHHNDRWALRLKQRRLFQIEACELARPYLNSALPQQALAKRIRGHYAHLFVFVAAPQVPPDNNAAERAIRPFVIMRKISGGTRSPAGSRTQSTLASLFATWILRMQDPLQQCQKLLANKPLAAPT